MRDWSEEVQYQDEMAEEVTLVRDSPDPSNKRVWRHDMRHAAELGDDDLPESWTPIPEYIHTRVARRKGPEPESRFLIRLRKPDLPPPPEAKLTTYDILTEVYQVLGPDNVVFNRITQVQAEFQQEMQQGGISRDELNRLRLALRQVRENHARRVDEIIDHFLDRYFRMYIPPKKKLF